MYPEVLDGLVVGGVYIDEPGGLLSNFALALTGWIIFFTTRNTESQFGNRWRGFVLLIALGATGGMWTHGFPHLFTREGFFVLWGVKNSFVPLANLIAGSACLMLMETQHKFAMILLMAKAILVTVAMFALYSFLPVAIDLGLTYVWVIVTTAKRSRQSDSQRWIFRAFVLAFASGFLYVFKYDIDPLWFTHKDTVHVFVIISLVFIGRAIVKFDFQRSESQPACKVVS